MNDFPSYAWTAEDERVARFERARVRELERQVRARMEVVEENES